MNKRVFNVNIYYPRPYVNNFTASLYVTSKTKIYETIEKSYDISHAALKYLARAELCTSNI